MCQGKENMIWFSSRIMQKKCNKYIEAESIACVIQYNQDTNVEIRGFFVRVDYVNIF